MKNLQKPTRLFAILALVLILAGCSAPTVVVPPTADVPRIRTEAAQTVVAKLTIEAALNPTASPTAAPAVSTATTAPAASNPTETPAVAQAAATATPIPTLTSVATIKPATGGGVVYPTATVRSGPDQAQYVSQSPADGAAYHAGVEFDGVWKIKNVGTSTWNSHYYYEWTGKGTNLAKTNRYYLKSDVKPGDTATLVTDMVAPSGGGRYVSYWQLRNDNGTVFYGFYIVIDVK